MKIVSYQKVENNALVKILKVYVHIYRLQRLISLLRAQRMDCDHPLGWKICDKRSGVLERLRLEYPSIWWEKILQTEFRQRALVRPTLLACVVNPRILNGEGILYFPLSVCTQACNPAFGIFAWKTRQSHFQLVRMLIVFVYTATCSSFRLSSLRVAGFLSFAHLIS